MGDKHRFEVFAKFVANILPKNYRIADIASGGGCLQYELRKLGFLMVTSWDNRHIKNRLPNQTYVRKYFDYTRVSPKHYDAIIGLHPDGATDHIVLWAATYGKKAIVVPCCAIPSASNFNGGEWISHLKQLVKNKQRKVIEQTLKIKGKNTVLIIT
jgi:hypothetical protein